MSIHVIRESDINNFLDSLWQKKLRLEMGRYEATSLGSKFGFFRHGRIIAFLQQCGNVTWSNDAITDGGDDWTDDITGLFN